MAECLGVAFGVVMRALSAQGLTPVGAPFAVYSPLGPDGFQVLAGFPVNGAVAPTGRVVPSARCVWSKGCRMSCPSGPSRKASWSGVGAGIPTASGPTTCT